MSKDYAMADGNAEERAMDGYTCWPWSVLPQFLTCPSTGVNRRAEIEMVGDVMDIADFVRRHLIDEVFPALPRDHDGQLRFTFFGWNMPEEWLWMPDRLLPVIVSVGAMKLTGGITPLREAPQSPVGYVLAEGLHTVSTSVVNAAMGGIGALSHFYHRKGDPRRTPVFEGTHMETMYIIDDETFWVVTKTQGLPAVWPGYRMLPDKFLDL